jgi:class 3 adenylate cyclase
MATIPQTRFARNGDVHIAYQTLGSGPLHLLLVDTWAHHVEAVWDFPDLARFLRRLTSFGRLIHFDRRGTGLSDPVPLDRLPDLETQVEDAITVLDAAGSKDVTVIGLNDGNLIATLLAAGHPERCRSLVLFTGAVGHGRDPGTPFEDIDSAIAGITATHARGGGGVDILAPSRSGDAPFEEQLARLQRYSVRPGAVGHYYRQTMESDVRDVLPVIRAPTLVLNREGNRVVPARLSREAASLIRDARYVELPGTDHLVYSQDVDAVLVEIEEFLTGGRTGADPDRVLATLLFTDIVDSTRRASELGDRGWRDLLVQHDRLVRAELERFRGREVKTTGDGFLAVFDGPARAVRCARALIDGVRALGIEIRTGIHTGEVEVLGDDVGGLAVHIAARVAGLAEGSEVLVSSTVRDLVAGSGIGFEARGEHELKGVPDPWRVFAVTRAP